MTSANYMSVQEQNKGTQVSKLKMGRITVFSRPNCEYCAEVKSLLDKKGLPYHIYNTADDESYGLWSIYLSGQTSLPQVFLNGFPVGGRQELYRLEDEGKLEQILSLVESTDTSYTLPDVDLNFLENMAKPVKLRNDIEPSDGTQSRDPEELPILQFYKMFFGWWPNCYMYLHHHPDTYKNFIYCTLMSVAGGQAKELLGEDLLCAVAFSTSEAQGCSYCQVHTAATTEHSLELVADLKESDGAGNFDELGKALIGLAGKASLNEVDQSLLDKIYALSPEKGEQYIHAVGQIASVFGFLNCFNDLVSVDIEGGWNKQVQERVSIDIDNHEGTMVGNPTNLNFEIPPSLESFPSMIGKYEAVVGDDLSGYLKEKLGIVPNWILEWFGPYQKRHSFQYVNLMNEAHTSSLTPELRHLISRVAATTKDHKYLAAIEGFMAHNASMDKGKTILRIRSCYNVATGTATTEENALFTESEIAALSCARASSLIPLKTFSAMTDPLVKHFDEKQLIEIFCVCGISGSVQRWSAVAKPEIEPEVEAFYLENELSLETIAAKLPFIA